MGNSYLNFPWIDNLLLNAKDARSRGALATRLGGGAGIA